jgi:hypothetical protein
MPIIGFPQITIRCLDDGIERGLGQRPEALLDEFERRRARFRAIFEFR